MTTHGSHPDTHEHGLADGCARCAELAAFPERGLDNDNARRIWFGPQYTYADLIARARMQDIADKWRWLERVIS